MKFRKLFLLIPVFLMFFLSSCNDPIVVEKYSETLEQGVYGAGDSLMVGRVDLAEQYIDGIEKIIPIPTSRITITPIISNGVHYVVLNDREKGSKVVIVSSTEFTALLKSQDIINQQQKAADAYAQQAQAQANIDAQQISALHQDYNDLETEKNNIVTEDTAKEAALQKTADEYEADYHNTIDYKVRTFFTVSLFSTPIIIGGLIALGVFCPAAIPIIFEIFGTIFGIVVRIFEFITNAISSLINLIPIPSPVTTVVTPPVVVVTPPTPPVSNNNNVSGSL